MVGSNYQSLLNYDYFDKLLRLENIKLFLRQDNTISRLILLYLIFLAYCSDVTVGNRPEITKKYYFEYCINIGNISTSHLYSPRLVLLYRAALDPRGTRILKRPFFITVTIFFSLCINN